ncbi:diguanylate cyclase domain-containing protein [Phycicoccus sp. Soil748]|uniref:diguanylate cyclase domain-containing protein n=1 Tax=Phycicoccus sp. Soil748 TaxID=1736397 RepID=UPI0012E39B65
MDDALQQLANTAEFRFSWGTAEWPKDDEDFDTVLRKADQSMYRMKAARKAAQTS